MVAKTLGVQQNECMFCILNNALDAVPQASYDPPVLRMAVPLIEQQGKIRDLNYDTNRSSHDGRSSNQPGQQHA
jgi:hypothetical protein